MYSCRGVFFSSLVLEYVLTILVSGDTKLNLDLASESNAVVQASSSSSTFSESSSKPKETVKRIYSRRRIARRHP